MFDFSDEQVERYSRHIILPEVGGEGQTRSTAKKSGWKKEVENQASSTMLTIQMNNLRLTLTQRTKSQRKRSSNNR
jgi:molybdopterin/thiamine biosynthesis adenylyltransferase